ncbi:MAG: hypothetical protein P8N50_00430 [Actinomycetota bacterium]|jgi:hypothetical protein|nr:hypothetical protein [Actinomycetota bacterium]
MDEERPSRERIPDPTRIELPGLTLAPTALPSALARALAFTAVLVAGLCGGLVGWAIADLQCVGECGTISTVGAVIGTVVAAGGVAIISVLVLRAMSEWNEQASLRERQR